ncbi:LOW QUALITY PROTEIN: ryncolin-1-like [Pecten maximus]|uniref:LOW QUALITY PROTEIN: ryncolin-1-like n=1 Tax=Pecten maximus TaxID=6579 RepID=UPI001458D89A|nr:LOW QUALITY PROTEIN: ryncolin-1-like [Pecten maximus]
MDLFTSICLAIFVAFISGGMYIMEERLSTLISVYEENTNAHERLASGTEKLIAAYDQHTTTNIQQNEDIQNQLRSINQSLSEVHMHLDAGQLKDCQDIKKSGNTKSGVYTIHVVNYGPTRVWCDMDTDGGGWTVFQRRSNGSVDFYRTWNEYKNGFGNLNGEFWLGNQVLHFLSSQGGYELRIDLEDYDQSKRFAVYKLFHVGSLDMNYKLTVRFYSGNAGDSLKFYNGRQFSTHDADHDTAKENCAFEYRGAWWYERMPCIQFEWIVPERQQ